MRRRMLIPVLASALVIAGAPNLAAQTPPDAPPGTVAFFVLAACPSGWSVAAQATGKLILGVTTGSFSGQENGEAALGNKEDRAHDHCYLATVTLAEKSISGGSGCCNTQGAKKGDYPVSGTTQAGTTGLPFSQLVVCEKQ